MAVQPTKPVFLLRKRLQTPDCLEFYGEVHVVDKGLEWRMLEFRVESFRFGRVGARLQVRHLGLGLGLMVQS